MARARHRSFVWLFSRCRIVLCAFSCVAGFILFVPVVAAQDSKISKLSTELFTLIRMSKPLSDGSRTAVVIDFSGPGTDVTELGVWLADQVSLDLAQTPRGYQMIDRKVFKEGLEEQKISSSLLQQEGPASCPANSAGASVFVLGSFTMHEDVAELSVNVFQTSDRKKIGETRHSIPLTPDLQALAGRLPPRPAVPGSLEPVTPSAEKYTPSSPMCVYCPNPQYNELARSAKVSGLVVLSVIITEDGHVENVSVAIGAPCGLTDRAIQTVQQWKLKPAKKPDGTPVAVKTAIEVVFRLL